MYISRQIMLSLGLLDYCCNLSPFFYYSRCKPISMFYVLFPQFISTKTLVFGNRYPEWKPFLFSLYLEDLWAIKPVVVPLVMPRGHLWLMYLCLSLPPDAGHTPARRRPPSPLPRRAMQHPRTRRESFCPSSLTWCGTWRKLAPTLISRTPRSGSLRWVVIVNVSCATSTLHHYFQKLD